MRRSHRDPPVTESRPSHLSEEKDGPAGSAALVRRAARGERDALERLLVEAQEVAWRFGQAVCGGADDAKDAMQEALVKTYQHVQRIRNPEAFRPWLYRTVRNACLMSRRRRTGEPTRMTPLDDWLPGEEAAGSASQATGPASPEALVMNRRLRKRLREALAQLPAEFRAVVFLREMEGLSTRETAETLGISEDNVKARLHRARLVLQKELREWNDDTSRPAPTGRRARRRES
jgi:RNA polymerase sigma-70 factor (ECF subfamily)